MEKRKPTCRRFRDALVIKGGTGLFVSFPAKKQRDGTHRKLAYPANAETRNMIQQVILAEYEKVVGGSDPVRSDSQKVNSDDR